MTEQTSRRLVDIESVAGYLSLKVPTIRAWVRLGKIPFYKIGRAVRFDLSEIDKWVDKKRVDFMNRNRLFHFLSFCWGQQEEFNLERAVEYENG